MEKEKFLADESLDYRFVKLFREKGHEVHAIVELERGISDEEVINMANDLEAIVLTEDTDFGELTYRLQKSSFGIVLLRINKVPFAERYKIMETAIEKFLPEFRNSFTVIKPRKIRVIRL